MDFSADQHTRLVALLIADSLSEVETKERDYLSALATEAGKLDEATAAAEAAKEAANGKPPKPTRLDGAKAIFAEKSALVAEVSALKTQLGQAKAEGSRVAAELAKATGDLAAMTTERDALQTQLAAATKEKQTLGEKTRDELASIGVPEKDLPAKGTGTKGSSVEDLEEQMRGTEDPKEKGRIARQLKAARQSLN